MINAPQPVETQQPALDQAAKLLTSQPALAAEKAQEFLRTSPNHPAATLLLGMARSSLGATVEAIEILEPLARARPDWPPAHYELGAALRLAGRQSEALESLRRAVRLKPDIGDAWHLIADLLLELGDPAGADRAYANRLVV